MNFIKVWTELDDGKFKSLPAKIVETNKNTFKIQYLSPTSKKTSSGKRVYAYEDDVYEITDESVIQKVDSELSLGFEELVSSSGNFVKFNFEKDDDEDEDYIPSSSCDDENSDSGDSGDSDDDSEFSSSSGDDDDDDKESYEGSEFSCEEDDVVGYDDGE